MAGLTRRAWLGGVSTAGIVVAADRVGAATGPERAFDLVIKGGELVDPSQSLRAVRDIGIRAGAIAAVEADIPAARGRRVVEAAGMLVMPSPVDLQPHTYPYGLASCDAAAYGDAPGAAWQPRLAGDGLRPIPVAGALAADPAREARAIAAAPGAIVGVRLQMAGAMSPREGLRHLRHAVRACEASGRPARVMVTVADLDTADRMAEVLDLLRAGDILTQAYDGVPDAAGRLTGLAPGGRLHPAARDARRRGVLFDLGRSGERLDFAALEAALAEGAPPDMIGAERRVSPGDPLGRPVLAPAVGRLLGLGLSLEQIVTMSARAPARLVGGDDRLGTLRVGAPADVTVGVLAAASLAFTDCRGNTRGAGLTMRSAGASARGAWAGLA